MTKSWSCEVGSAEVVPDGGDSPLRRAVGRAYEEVVGRAPDFISSGWGSLSYHSSVFKDQRYFMEACGQTTRDCNPEQVRLYRHLIAEEAQEFADAATTVDEVDAALDLIVVCCGFLLSLGLEPQELWDEVQRSNMAKRQPDGRVYKREDGKILKPDGWTKPQLARIMESQLAARRR